MTIICKKCGSKVDHTVTFNRLCWTCAYPKLTQTKR